MLDNDLIESGKSNQSSPCILVPKLDVRYRLCDDYRKVNAVTKTDTYAMPRIDYCIDEVANAKFVSKFDLLKCFWQVLLTERGKEISAFVNPSILFQYTVMPIGTKNSPATFHKLIHHSGCFSLPKEEPLSTCLPQLPVSRNVTPGRSNILD